MTQKNNIAGIALRVFYFIYLFFSWWMITWTVSIQSCKSNWVPGKLSQNIFNKMEVVVIGKATVAFFIHDLHCRAYRRNAVSTVMSSCVQMPWERSHARQFWEVIIPNTFDYGHWLRNFRMTQTTFEMPCNEFGLLLSPVIQSHLRIEGFIL